MLLCPAPILTGRIPDPRLKQSLAAVYEKLDVDLLTWRSIVGNALFGMYGLVGQARHFDVLVKQRSMPALKCIIRIQNEDSEVFATSISNYSFALGDYLGSELDMSARVLVVALLAYLGMVSPLE